MQMRIFIAMIAAAVSACAPSIVAANKVSVNPNLDLPQMYSATAFGQAGTLAGKSFGLDVSVTRWTSEEEILEFVATLKNKGPYALVKALEKTNAVGRLAPTGFVGSEFRIARYRPTAGGGSHIVMVTNRPIAFAEAYSSTRSKDYQFGIVVLDIDQNGKGTGTLAPVCKINFNKKNELVIEHFGQKPFRLANVRRLK